MSSSTDNNGGPYPTLPPDVPTDRCPACGMPEPSHADWYEAQYGHPPHRPATNPDGTAKGSRGALWCVLGVAFLAIVAVLAIVALGGP